MTERLYEATARSYVISPRALAEVAPDPGASADRLSAGWLAALGARLVSEVGELIDRARSTGRPVATLGLDADLRFASARDRADFATELTAAVDALVTKYHVDESRGRAHRLVVALHPRPSHSHRDTQKEGDRDA
jgi:hypothetical protein